MEQKICFVRCPRPDEHKEGFIHCDSTYIPLTGEIVGFFPYPFVECFVTGDNHSTCHELFIEKLDKDLCTAERRVEKYQKILDQFIDIRENYEF